MLINITCAKIAQVQKWNYICCQNNFYAHFAYNFTNQQNQ